MPDAAIKPPLGTLHLLGAAAVGAGALVVVVKGHGRLVHSMRAALAYWRNPLRHQHVQICTTFDECQAAVEKLKAYCAEYRVIGFDCEWVTVNASRRPVALLQLATHNGYCALIRINRLSAGGRGASLPAELRELLANGDIVKVGVVPMDDSRYLARDYGLCVAGTLDLRHMAQAGGRRPLGLAKMALEHLAVTMDKDWRISCSDWEAPRLTDRQVDYAAKDALVAIELFRLFAGHRSVLPWRVTKTKDLDETLAGCAGWLDVGFTVGGAARGGSAAKKQAMKNLKPPKRSMSTRVTPLYENCYLQAPDGQLLCTCDRRKAEWYLQKDIGELVTAEPYTVRLKFEPAGRAVGESGRFYQLEKENRCVVCGSEESYQRKNIVPREYRKYFPSIMKDHTSHDILLLCPDCHQRSNIADLQMRHRLAQLANAPFTGSEVVAPTIENSDRKRLKSAARALHTNGAKIPAARVKQLRDEVLAYQPVGTELSDALLKELAEISTHEPNVNYFAHGEKVVGYFCRNTGETGGLVELERMWRMHFLDVMVPRYMPELWSVEHSVDKLGIRIAENRITKDELQLSGLRLADQQTVENAS